MTRTEFDAAFKLALGYKISELTYSWEVGNESRCVFKKNGINVITKNEEKFIEYDKLIDHIPSIKENIRTYAGGEYAIINIYDVFPIVLQR